MSNLKANHDKGTREEFENTKKPWKLQQKLKEFVLIKSIASNKLVAIQLFFQLDLTFIMDFHF